MCRVLPALRWGYSGQQRTRIPSNTNAEHQPAAAHAQVYLCARSWQNPDWAHDGAPLGARRNVWRRPPPTELHADGGVSFAGGERVDAVDVVRYATGYVYTFPFLEGTGVVTVDDNRRAVPCASMSAEKPPALTAKPLCCQSTALARLYCIQSLLGTVPSRSPEHAVGWGLLEPRPATRSVLTLLLAVHARRVAPLYQHMFPPAVAPTLSFIGLPWKVVPFAQYELQVSLLPCVLSGHANAVGVPRSHPATRSSHSTPTITLHACHSARVCRC